MTIRNNLLPSPRYAGQRKHLHKLAYPLALLSLAGCGSINSLMESDRLDYKSAAKSSISRLEIPPDLTQLQRDNRYAIPEANRGTATASGYNLEQGLRPTTSSNTPIAPKTKVGIRVERDGKQRWLVVEQAPEILWSQVKDFWQDSGFLINIESPETGVMETDWAENRAKIPLDFIRKTLGKALDTFYSTGERDKFRTRMERGANGTTEIYISHRGAEEVLVGQQKDSTLWTMRPSDPELEAEFLSRLMTRLGTDGERAKVAIATATPQIARAKLINDANGAYVEVDESFDRAWRRVGLALDRVGFTVEDRDRTKGTYFVRYVDQDKEAQNKATTTEKGFLSKLFSFGSGSQNKAISAQRYRVVVKESGASSQVVVLNDEGRAEKSKTADQILSLLNEQLK